MSYCVNCGVELGSSERKCPLCQTEVYNPAAPPRDDAILPYPVEQDHGLLKMKPKYGLLIATLTSFLPAILAVICDFSINKELVWSGFVVGAVVLLYCIIFVPLLIKNKNIFFYLIPDFLICAIFQYYIEYVTNGSWFLNFSLPITCSVLLFLSTLILISKHTKSSDLMITAFAFIFSGIECLLIEVLINNHFKEKMHFIWSYYPLITFIVIGIVLIVLDKNQKLKHKFEKFFFI